MKRELSPQTVVIKEQTHNPIFPLHPWRKKEDLLLHFGVDSIDVMCVLGSAVRVRESLFKPPPGFFERGFTLEPTDIAKHRLYTAIEISDYDPAIPIVTCGRNPNNFYEQSDAEVLGELARAFEVENPVIALPRPMNMFTELMDISGLALRSGWNVVMVITDKEYHARARAMIETIYHPEDTQRFNAMVDYLNSLYEKYPTRVDDIDAFLAIAESLREQTYTGNFLLAGTLIDHMIPYNLEAVKREEQGISLWQAGAYR